MRTNRTHLPFGQMHDPLWKAKAPFDYMREKSESRSVAPSQSGRIDRFKSSDYLIVSPYHSAGFITFWRPNGANYADPIEWVGTYTREEAGRKFTKTDWNSNKWDSFKDFAVPASTLTLDRLEQHWVDGEFCWLLPNYPRNRAILMLASRKSFPEKFFLKPLNLPG